MLSAQDRGLSAKRSCAVRLETSGAEQVFRLTRRLTANVIASGAKQSSLLKRLDCFVADAPPNYEPLISSPRDHIGFIVEPQPAVLAQHLAGRVEIAAVQHHVAEPVVLDLRNVDRGVPRRERRRRADGFGYLR